MAESGGRTVPLPETTLPQTLPGRTAVPQQTHEEGDQGPEQTEDHPDQTGPAERGGTAQDPESATDPETDDPLLGPEHDVGE